MIDAYIDDETLQHAARIAYLFKQNLIDVLRSPASEWLMWSAAYRVIAEDKKAEAEAMKANSKKKR